MGSRQLIAGINIVEKVKNGLVSIAPDIFGRTPVLFSYLFGSYATDCVHPFSDIDIGVYIGHSHYRRTFDLEMSLAIEIDEKLEVGISADVRMINNLPLVIAGKIVTDGILIYSKDEIARVDFETAIRSKYFDFLPVIRAYHSAYLNSIASGRIV